MARPSKKNNDQKGYLILIVFAFFVLIVAYVFVKLDASLNRPHAGVSFETTQIQIGDPNATTSTIGGEERIWQNAEAAFMNYFAAINAGKYEEAIAMRAPNFLVGTIEAYVEQLRSSKENEILGDVSITNIERIEEESSENKKVFRFQKSAVWSFDGTTHSEIKKAILGLHDGEWLIDYFELERKF